MILVTGGSGMVGTALKSFLPNGKFISSEKYDLRDKKAVANCFDEIKPDIVVHLAALVGGIVANSSAQYDFFYENILMNTNVLHEAKNHNCFVVYASSTCAYPKYDMLYPLKEEDVFKGAPEETNRSYAYAKRMGQVQLESAADQYGIKSCVIYFSNLYGREFRKMDDCFDFKKLHFISAAMYKMYIAKISGLKEIKLLGTGKPLRQFTHVNDAAASIKCIIDSQVSGIFNLANFKSYSIAEAADIISKTVGYEGQIVFNGDLDGLYRKDVSVKKFIAQFPDFQFTTLEEGINETYQCFQDYILPA